MAGLGTGVRASRIDLATTPDFDLGRLRVRPAHRKVCINGDCRELEPRIMQVLVALAAGRPEVVSRDRLFEECWNGRVVGDDALNRCVVALRHLAKETDPPAFVIQTVPRVGYSLEVPSATEGASPPPNSARKTNLGAGLARKPALLLLISLAMLAATLTGIYLWRTDRISSTDQAPASIAVLPFRNLSDGDPYFAEGMSDEILARLAREPQFRVAGRTSSGFFKDAADLREVGRKLDVKYVLEGSVRTQAGRVRVNAALVQVKDGMRLWSSSYDGSLDDIFAIQRQIGNAIAAALKRQLVRLPPSGPLVTRGDVYSLYLTAKGLMRTRKPSKAATAAELLRRALELDPNYAPAWSSLGKALRLAANAESDDTFLKLHQEATTHVRHALKLAPNLAEAHGALGMILGFASPEAAAHIRRASQLNPNDGEILFWLGHVEGNAGRFDRQLAAYRRAVQIEPLLPTAIQTAAEMAREMGYRELAEQYVARGAALGPAWHHGLQGFLAYQNGDYSEAVRHWLAGAQGPGGEERYYFRSAAGSTLRMLGLPDQGRIGPNLVDPELRVIMTEPPAAETWRARTRNPVAEEVLYRPRNLVAAKLMLAKRRHSELLETYDSPAGLLGLKKGQRPRLDQLQAVPVVALALRAGGRNAEADRLLAEADSTIRAVLAQQRRTPSWLHANAAAVWALQGRHDQALTALERAVSDGWMHADQTDLPDIGDEPGFQSLRGNGRFEAIRTRISRHLARESREAAALLRT